MKIMKLRARKPLAVGQPSLSYGLDLDYDGDNNRALNISCNGYVVRLTIAELERCLKSAQQSEERLSKGY